MKSRRHISPHKTRAALDTTARFFEAWRTGKLPVPYAPCRSEHLYPAYLLWAQGAGIPKPPPARDVLATVGRLPGVRKTVAWHRFESDQRVQRMVVFPPGSGPLYGQSATAWVSASVREFCGALCAWRYDRQVDFG